jgi:hypothetical protein
MAVHIEVLNPHHDTIMNQESYWRLNLIDSKIVAMAKDIFSLPIFILQTAQKFILWSLKIFSIVPIHFHDTLKSQKTCEEFSSDTFDVKKLRIKIPQD